MAVGSAAHASTSASTTPSTAPAAVLDGNVNGRQAVAELGATLPSTAAAAGMEPAELKSELLSDPELWIDRTGKPMYVDTSMAPPPQAGAPTTAPANPYPYADTFTLHSRPTSTKVIYLDFDGYTVTGTGWNTSYTAGSAFTAEPFDADGTSSSFSDSEKDIIQSVWQRMAEDYAPFDVDVTTEEPDQANITRTDDSDTHYGTRLVITNTNTIYSVCNCGGIAYLGVFDQPGTHAQYQPAFVFTRGSQSDKFIAEAGSHEVGHNLGLSHDGTASLGYYGGQADWAPIMGVGYNKPVTQWSKGEYKGANNKQDDFVVMGQNGASLLTDDFGDTTATAEFVGATFPTSKSGIITTAKDLDLFKFNAGAGEVTVTVSVAPNSPNLDVALELLNSKGKSVAKNNVASAMVSAEEASGMDATITATVVAGTYFVKIDGSGNGSGSTGYSDYGSVGAYKVEIAAESGSGLTNTVPTAKVTTATTTVGVPGPITLTNVGSTDADGKITGTAWDFGDGTAAGSGASVTHTYSTAGTYTVSMTVTDNSGATAVKTQKITAVPALKVASITTSKETVKGKPTASATVKITDASDVNVEGASVGVTFTYGTKKVSGTGKTAADGTVTVKGPAAAAGTEVTATVTKASVKGKQFNPGLGSGVTATITL